MTSTISCFIKNLSSSVKYFITISRIYINHAVFNRAKFNLFKYLNVLSHDLSSKHVENRSTSLKGRKPRGNKSTSYFHGCLLANLERH